MTPGPREVVALAHLSHLLNRDLQRAARRVGGPLALLRSDDDTFCAALGATGTGERAPVLEARRRVDPEHALQLVHDRGLTVIPSGGPDTSPLLAQLYDPPFGLFTMRPDRCIAAWDGRRPVVAIVGSRRTTAASAAFATDLSAELVRRGAVIVSGLARGIDAAAHQGALDAGGTTLAVLGAGTDSGYPRANAGLRRRIETHGAVISEYWPETEPAPWRFPARNRIVAGVAHGVVVIDAAATSGALITADFGVEAGRPVLAVPHAPWEPGGAGAVNLIAIGAAVCRGADDVVAEIPHEGWLTTSDAAGPDVPDGTPTLVWEALAAPRSLEDLVAVTSAGPGEVGAALAGLELDGIVMRDEGQRWRRTPTA